MAGRRTPWDFMPRRDAANQYMRNHLDLNIVESRARILSEPDRLGPRGPLN
jgi:choline-sulfatase